VQTNVRAAICYGVKLVHNIDIELVHDIFDSIVLTVLYCTCWL